MCTRLVIRFGLLFANICLAGKVSSAEQADSSNPSLAELIAKIELLQSENEFLRNQSIFLRAESIRAIVLNGDIPAIAIENQGRLTDRLSREYSAIRCVGPGSTLAIQSRHEHPHSGIDDSQLRAGEETDYYGGCKQRACHIRNACVTAHDPRIIVHMDPNGPDLGASILKAEADDALGGRFFRLQTHRDGQDAAAPLAVRRGRIRDSVASERPPSAIDPEPGGAEWAALEWHAGVYAYLEPFARDHFGHVIFDDLFGSFAAFRALGLDPLAGRPDLNLLADLGCDDGAAAAGCPRYYGEWARGAAAAVLVRRALAPGALHCFDGLVVGTGQFAGATGVFHGKELAKAPLYRDFRRLVLRRLRVAPPPAGGAAHRVLANEKRAGRRRVLNFPEVLAAVEGSLGISAAATPPDMFDLPAKARPAPPGAPRPRRRRMSKYCDRL